ncbi:response regulator transcription factor [Streptomyces sp. NPDC000070]|uniref:response regulator transcription factor n=1 Tax=Streptomyces sp. NPDC000070 TaxID=3154240 RepID=UPI00332F8A7C
MRVLVVENSAESAEYLCRELRRHGHETVVASTGAAAIDAGQDADLILLDLELPDRDGVKVCREMRARWDTGIIAFTERNTELDRILGLQAGADDCLCKPVGFRELMARIDAVMRRIRPRAAAVGRESLSLGPLRVNAAMREVWLHGELVETTRKEFDLLYYLASRPGTVIRREELMADVWRDPMNHGLSLRASRTIDTHVSTLRNKLGSSGWIRTVRGVGFRFGVVDELDKGRPMAGSSVRSC